MQKELAIISILPLPDLLLTYSGLLGYIKVNLFSIFRTFNYTYLLYSFTQKKGQDILFTPPDEGSH